MANSRLQLVDYVGYAVIMLWACTVLIVGICASVEQARESERSGSLSCEPGGKDG